MKQKTPYFHLPNSVSMKDLRRLHKPNTCDKHDGYVVVYPGSSSCCPACVELVALELKYKTAEGALETLTRVGTEEFGGMTALEYVHNVLSRTVDYPE